MKEAVLFLFRNMGTGGAQKIEAFVANALDDDGYEVIAINMSDENISIKLNDSIRIINLNYEEVALCKNKYKQTVYKILYLIKLRKIIKELHSKVLCVFLSDVVRMAVLATKGLNIKIIGSERGDPNSISKTQFNKYRNAYQKCAAVVFQLGLVKDMYNISNGIKQYIIPNPCVPRQGGFINNYERNSKIIVSAGRLSHQKRFDLLIDAFSLVLKKYSNYKLIIYGNGPEKDNLDKQIKKLNLSNCVKLHKAEKDVFRVCGPVMCFVLSSDFEGIPNVLIEAMASGIPCISTDCSPGGARYLLKNGEYGLIVDKGNSRELANAMIEYIEDYKIRELKALKSKNISSELDPDLIKKMWLNVFKNII